MEYYHNFQGMTAVNRAAHIILLCVLSVTARHGGPEDENSPSPSTNFPASTSSSSLGISPIILPANPTPTPTSLSATPPAPSTAPPMLPTTSPAIPTAPTFSTTGAPSFTTSTRSTISPTLTATTPATPTSPSIAESFQFDAPKNATTCQNTSFSWHFSGSSSVLLTIDVTNEQVAEAMSRTSVTPLVWRTLSTNVSPDALAILWPVVDVTQGWYAAVAFDTQRTSNVFIQSPSFFVRNGSDVQCLTAPSTSPVATFTPPFAHAHINYDTLAGVVAGLATCVILITAVLTAPWWWKRPTRKASAFRVTPKRPAYKF